MNVNNFELESDQELPWNERFSDVADLVGHKILAAFHEPSNKNGEYGAGLVLVTETGCWLVLNAGSDSCGEDPSIQVQKPVYYGRDLTLHDFVNARDLHRTGVINGGEYAVMAKVEADLKAEKNARRAAQLRAQLEALSVKPDA